MIFVVRASSPIPPVCMDLFYVAARKIYGAADVDHADFHSSEFEGRVSYAGKSGCLGSVSGPLFEGVLEIGDRPTIRVTFVCRRSSLPEATRLGIEHVRLYAIPLPPPVRFAEYVPDTSGMVQ